MPTPIEVRLPDVLGIKFGPLANYLLLRDVDANTLYFCMDRGLIFRGKKLCTPINVVEADTSGTGASQQTTFTLTYYGAAADAAKLYLDETIKNYSEKTAM